MSSRDAKIRRASSRTARPSSKYNDWKLGGTSDSDDPGEGWQGYTSEDAHNKALTRRAVEGWMERGERLTRSGKQKPRRYQDGWDLEGSDLDLAEDHGSRQTGMPDFLSALSFLKQIAAKKIHPAACYRTKGDPAGGPGKRRARDTDAEDYLPQGKRQAPERQNSTRTRIIHPVADAVAQFVTQRGQQWQSTMDRAATSARSRAAVEAEEAARAARKHVYILAGYAEPSQPSPCASGQDDGSGDQPGQQKGGVGADAGGEGASRCTEGRSSRGASLPPLWLPQPRSFRMQMPSPLWQLPAYLPTAQAASNATEATCPTPPIWQPRAQGVPQVGTSQPSVPAGAAQLARLMPLGSSVATKAAPRPAQQPLPITGCPLNESAYQPQPARRGVAYQPNMLQLLFPSAYHRPAAAGTAAAPGPSRPEGKPQGGYMLRLSDFQMGPIATGRPFQATASLPAGHSWRAAATAPSWGSHWQVAPSVKLVTGGPAPRKLPGKGGGASQAPSHVFGMPGHEQGKALSSSAVQRRQQASVQQDIVPTRQGSIIAAYQQPTAPVSLTCAVQSAKPPVTLPPPATANSGPLRLSPENSTFSPSTPTAAHKDVEQSSQNEGKRTPQKSVFSVKAFAGELSPQSRGYFPAPSLGSTAL